eukprot:scaffold85001_cov34-Tisochrysis_lutea.AAC.1
MSMHRLSPYMRTYTHTHTHVHAPARVEPLHACTHALAPTQAALSTDEQSDGAELFDKFQKQEGKRRRVPLPGKQQQSKQASAPGAQVLQHWFD